VDCGLAKTVDELTDRTIAQAEQFARRGGAMADFGSKTSCPQDLLGMLHRTEKAHEALRRDIRCAVAASGDIDIYLHYSGDPVLHPGVSRRMHVTCRRHDEIVPAVVKLEGPKGWQVNAAPAGGPPAFDITAPIMDKAAKLRMSVEIDGKTYTAEFTVLSPNDAQGYPDAVQSTEWSPGMTISPFSPKLPGMNFVSPRGDDS
jgi:hypothetical protein